MSKASAARLLDLTHLVRGRKVLVLGDLHGCFDEFLDMLDLARRFGFRVGEDVLLSCGDLSDRGPKIIECFNYFMTTPHAYVVNSNHDDKFLRYLLGNPVAVHTLSATIDQFKDHLSNRAYYECLVSYLRSLPEIIKFGPFVMAHASLRPDMPLDAQNVNDCIRGRTPPVKPMWTETAFFGHDVSPHWIIDGADQVRMIDGGCVFGGKLRAALIIEDVITILEVNAKKNHYEEYLKKYRSSITIPASVFLSAHAR